MYENSNKKYFYLNTDFREENLIDKEKLNKAENEFVKLNSNIKLSYKLEQTTFIETYSTLISNISKVESVSTSQIEGSPITIRKFQEGLSKTKSKSKYSMRIRDIMKELYSLMNLKEICKNPMIYLITDYPKFQ